MIGFDQAAQGTRRKAEELPAFSNHSACAACGNGREIRVHRLARHRRTTLPEAVSRGAQWAE